MKAGVPLLHATMFRQIKLVGEEQATFFHELEMLRNCALIVSLRFEICGGQHAIVPLLSAKQD